MKIIKKSDSNDYCPFFISPGIINIFAYQGIGVVIYTYDITLYVFLIKIVGSIVIEASDTV